MNNTTIICPIKPRGMGTTVHENGETGYGFPETTDPERFHPDYEMCTKEEIKNHKAALALASSKEKNNKPINTDAEKRAPVIR